MPIIPRWLRDRPNSLPRIRSFPQRQHNPRNHDGNVHDNAGGCDKLQRFPSKDQSRLEHEVGGEYDQEIQCRVSRYDLPKAGMPEPRNPRVFCQEDDQRERKEVIEERDAVVRDISRSMGRKHTQVICFKGYRWELLGSPLRSQDK